jgi:hypothetical protein
MTILSFSNASLIALNQLESQMRREIGVRHNLSQDSSLYELIQLASSSENSKIRKAFKFFESSLDIEQKKALTYRGVNFDKASKENVPASSQPTVYRGVVTQKSQNNAEQPQKKEKKGVVYRGQTLKSE